MFFDDESFLYQHTVYESHTVTLAYQEVLQKMITNDSTQTSWKYGEFPDYL